MKGLKKLKSLRGGVRIDVDGRKTMIKLHIQYYLSIIFVF